MIPITEDGGIMKEIVVTGTGPYPIKGYDVEVRYEGRLENGMPFDGTPRDRTFVFQLGKQQVIKAWDLAVAGMRVGERSLFNVREDYGYAEKGFPPMVPPHTNLRFMIELLSTSEPVREKFQLTEEEKLAKAQRFKEMGNKLFQEKFYRRALTECYVEGLTFIEDQRRVESFIQDYIQNPSPEFRAMRVLLHSNAALCAIKIKAWGEVFKHCDRGLTDDPKNYKLMHRRATAFLATNKLAEARKDIDIAFESAPTVPEVVQLRAEIAKRESEEFEKERKMRGGWFGKAGMYDEKPTLSEYVIKPLPMADNPKVYFDIKIGDKLPLRVTFELFKDALPKTAENFRSLCTGEKGLGSSGKPLSFQGSVFHRVVRGFGMQGGDITNGDGTGGESIYGSPFEDENFRVFHSIPGLLSMSSPAPHSNTSQFYITFAPAPQLNGKSVAFGRVLGGMEVCSEIENLPVGEDGRPGVEVRIEGCGMLPS